MSKREDSGRGKPGGGAQQENEHNEGGLKMYLRFAAMILTGMVVMYWAMFVSSWEWSHVRWSPSRLFMALTMGGAMGLVMLAWMSNMMQNMKANLAVVAASLLLLGLGVFLDRSQAPVGDNGFMSGMIPHHSLAITRAERAGIQDFRVCELAVAIIKAQQREISEMDWLIDDIRDNGVARTANEAEKRPVPHFPEPSIRSCPGQ